MNTTILTDEQIIRILEENRSEYDGLDKAIAVSRAIEQAVLQSEQVQAWKLDTKRLDWLESCEDSHGFCHAGYGDYIYYAHQVTGMPSVREVIDAAIRSNKNDTKHDGGSASPFGQISETTGQPVNGFYDPGMTLRDYFAAKALPMCMTANESARTVAEMAYGMADAMLAQRKKLVEQYNDAVKNHDGTEQQI